MAPEQYVIIVLILTNQDISHPPAEVLEFSHQRRKFGVDSCVGKIEECFCRTASNQLNLRGATARCTPNSNSHISLVTPKIQATATAEMNNQSTALATASREMDMPTPVSQNMSVRRSTTGYNPVYLAMLSANTMRDCSQVQAMMTQCLQSFNDGKEDHPFMCQTAEQYYLKCSKGQA